MWEFVLYFELYGIVVMTVLLIGHCRNDCIFNRTFCRFSTGLSTGSICGPVFAGRRTRHPPSLGATCGRWLLRISSADMGGGLVVGQVMHEASFVPALYWLSLSMATRSGHFISRCLDLVNVETIN